jgi:hypothetical protein
LFAAAAAVAMVVIWRSRGGGVGCLEEEVIAGVAGEVGVGVVVGIGRGLEDERRKRRLVCLSLLCAIVA